MSHFTIWKYGIYGVLILSLINVFYYLLEGFQENKVLQRYGGWLDKKGKNRKLREYDLRRSDGEQQRSHFLYRIDLMMMQSNLNRIFPFLNTEIYVLFTLLAGISGGLILNLTSDFWLWGILCMLGILFISYLILYILSSLNHKRIEGSLLIFLNLLENYSKTTDDIVKIFGQAYPFIEEPLRTYIREFSFEAINDGDTARAFNNLEYKVGHEKLKDIIHNIELCSRHEANYEEIIKDHRFSLTEYLSIKEEKKSIINNGRIEILLLLAASGVCLSIFGGLVQNMYSVLFGTMGGNILLGLCGILIIYCLWIMVSIRKD